MRTTFLVLAGFAPLAACSEAFVTAPSPAAPVVPALRAVPTQGHTAPERPVLRIRGVATHGPPLFVIDGVVVSWTPINTLDIEEIEVIKGPAAATLYAPRTNCPAIVIRTKRPSSTPSPAR